MPSKPEVIKARRENDPEYVKRLRGYTKKYREKNIESERERNRLSAAARRSSSREAYNAYMREWTTANKDRLNSERRERLLTDTEYAERVRKTDRERYAQDPESHRNVRLKSTYGITLKDYRKMYLEQNGECAICHSAKPDSGKKGLVVDHCHDKGHVRKLLCFECNTGLGRFRDNPEILANAIEYLKEKR